MNGRKQEECVGGGALRGFWNGIISTEVDIYIHHAYVRNNSNFAYVLRGGLILLEALDRAAIYLLRAADKSAEG